MFTLQDLSFSLPNGYNVFEHVDLAIGQHDRLAIIGNNGSGKSTLLKIIAGDIQPSGGQCIQVAQPYLIPQIYGQFNHLTVAQALKIDKKLNALQQILKGELIEPYLSILNDDWTIESRCEQAFDQWDLGIQNLNQSMTTLSGGEKTKLMLSGIQIHEPELVLMDEPSNHLDMAARKLLYEYIGTTSDTLIMVSHDRKMLNLSDRIAELTRNGLKIYGGNYDFYHQQKQLEENAIKNDLHSTEKALRKAREKERETIERKQKLDSRGKSKQEKAGLPTISMKTFKNNAEKSAARVKEDHTLKIDIIRKARQELREKIPAVDTIRFGFEDSQLHRNKTIFLAKDINFAYERENLWKASLSFEIESRDRILLCGKNGSGKTTLLKMILGDLTPTEGSVNRPSGSIISFDQEYSLINNELTVFEQAELFNTAHLPDHEVRNRLNKFLFNKEQWDKNCGNLSGGEKMRLLLCCLTITTDAPSLIILDEPTNNLDIQNVDILTEVINLYSGALLVVSHDETFTAQLSINKEIVLS